ncbi:MAG: hypothetical protein SOY71_01130, partial [Dialister sp.]|nr:hypothetical protein [Dialister sp.]
MVACRSDRCGRCDIPDLRKEAVVSSLSLAALGVTYLVSALACVLLFEAFSPAGDLMAALATVPFPAAIAGVSIAGLEVGTIYMYRAG